MPDVIAVTDAPPIEPRPEDDEFSQAFAQLSVANDAARGGEAPPKPELETPMVDDELPPDDTQVAAAALETAKPEATASQDKTAAPPAAPASAAPQPPKFTDEELARFAAIAQQVARPQQPPPQPQQQQEVSPYNQEEIALINEYMQEYPEIARAEALSRRKDIFDAVRYVLGEVNRALGPTVQEVNRLAQRTHAGDLQTLVPDFRLTREQAIEWAMQQPDFLQPGYLHVIQHGTPQQVANFEKMYQASQPATTPVAASNGHAVAAAPRQQVQETPAQRRAVAALTPVPTKRSGISTDVIEPGDFDSAFERYAAQADRAAQALRR